MPAPLMPQLHCWLCPGHWHINITASDSREQPGHLCAPSASLWQQPGCLQLFCVSCLQAQVWIPAQWDDTWHQNYYSPQKDWHPAGLWELQTVIFQRGYRPAPSHIQLTLPALRTPLLCTGNTWYLKDTYWNYNTSMDCPPITCVLQLPHLRGTCIDQCSLSALTAPSYSI